MGSCFIGSFFGGLTAIMYIAHWSGSFTDDEDEGE